MTARAKSKNAQNETIKSDLMVKLLILVKIKQILNLKKFLK